MSNHPLRRARVPDLAPGPVCDHRPWRKNRPASNPPKGALAGGAGVEGSRAQPGLPATSPNPSSKPTRRRGDSPAWPSGDVVNASVQRLPETLPLRRQIDSIRCTRVAMRRSQRNLFATSNPSKTFSHSSSNIFHFGQKILLPLKAVFIMTKQLWRLTGIKVKEKKVICNMFF